MGKKKKHHEGVHRNVNEKKKRLKKAVGKILREKGFGNLGVNKVSFESGISKNLIYRYFGNYRSLIEQYSIDIDFWLNEISNRDLSSSNEIDTAKYILKEQFNYLLLNPEMRQLVLWELHESNYNTTSLLKKREEFAEQLILKKTDEIFRQNIDFRAVVAILVASVYHLASYSSVQKATFCGIDLSERKGQNRILDAINLILDMVYEHNEKAKK